MTETIANLIETELETAGVAVVVEAEHSCMSIRGIKKPGSARVTSAMRGVFRKNPGVVRSLGVHVGLQRIDDSVRGILAEDEDRVDASQRGDDLHPLVLREQRPLGALGSADGLVRVHSDDKVVAQGPGVT